MFRHVDVPSADFHRAFDAAILSLRLYNASPEWPIALIDALPMAVFERRAGGNQGECR
jgi:hypothetical protein